MSDYFIYYYIIGLVLLVIVCVLDDIRTRSRITVGTLVLMICLCSIPVFREVFILHEIIWPRITQALPKFLNFVIWEPKE